MQYALIALIVVVAVALVAIPFIRAPRGAAASDLDAPDRGVTPGVQDRPAPRATPELTVPGPAESQPPGEAGAEELPQAAPPPPGPSRPLGGSAAPSPPLGARPAPSPPLGGSAAPVRTQRRAAVGPVARADTRLELEILRYREALRAGTICEHCSSANPPGSRFCKECGEQL